MCTHLLLQWLPVTAAHGRSRADEGRARAADGHSTASTCSRAQRGCRQRARSARGGGGGDNVCMSQSLIGPFISNTKFDCI